MNASSSECSSGCDSGWTHYFQPSSLSGGEDDDVIPSSDPKKGGFGKNGFEDEEEEDLSMVSDASSGPPVHYDAIEADEAPRRATRKDCKRQKMNKQGQDRDFRSLLDDTASSPATINNHHVWKAGLEIPEGGRSVHQEHFGFFHSHHNIITGDHHDNQWFGRKKMKKMEMIGVGPCPVEKEITESIRLRRSKIVQVKTSQHKTTLTNLIKITPNLCTCTHSSKRTQPKGDSALLHLV